jgi:hypothetical protein
MNVNCFIRVIQLGRFSRVFVSGIFSANSRIFSEHASALFVGKGITLRGQALRTFFRRKEGESITEAVLFGLPQ